MQNGLGLLGRILAASLSLSYDPVPKFYFCKIGNSPLAVSSFSLQYHNIELSSYI